MTLPINNQNQQFPAYSGITINITNPTLMPPNNCNYPNCNHSGYQTVPQQVAVDKKIYPEAVPSDTYQIPEHSLYEMDKNSVQNSTNKTEQDKSEQNKIEYNKDSQSNTVEKEVIKESSVEKMAGNFSKETKDNTPNTEDKIPAQYYINNGTQNIQTIPQSEPLVVPKEQTSNEEVSPEVQNIEQKPNVAEKNSIQEEKEEDLSTSKEIINNLDTRVAEQEKLEKSGKKVRVIALTNEYIMSLENYLNNPNKEIRLMASKEILTRLDEDKDRYDDAALNALLNKMLQDPNKLVRIAALSALSGGLASGNDYTVQLLKGIENNPNADKEDVIQAANILLKMSATTELKYFPVKESKKESNSNKDLEAAQKKMEQLQAQLQKYKEKEIEQILKSQQV